LAPEDGGAPGGFAFRSRAARPGSAGTPDACLREVQPVDVGHPPPSVNEQESVRDMTERSRKDMTKEDRDRSATPTASPRGPDRDGSLVVLEDGDAGFEPHPDAVRWDWDADAVAAPEHCELCGALEPLFRLEDGPIACGACCHGRTWKVPPVPLPVPS
jgi:hypothetical protein